MTIDLARLTTTLAQLHQTVRGTVERTTTTNEARGRNRKGDVPEPCDLAADQELRRFLGEHFSVASILSEEGDDDVGQGRGEYQFVIDPVDGSDNFRRSLPSSTICVAAIPAGLPLAIDSVEWAMVGDYRAPAPAVAVRGAGAWLGGKRLATSGVTDVPRACLHFELNQHPPSRPISRLFERAGAVRSYCSTAYAIYLLAQGSLDAHLDIRRRVTPESYLAASLLLTEAGGVLSNSLGERIEPFENLTDRRDIVAAATPELAQELILFLRDR